MQRQLASTRSLPQQRGGGHSGAADGSAGAALCMYDRDRLTDSLTGVSAEYRLLLLLLLCVFLHVFTCDNVLIVFVPLHPFTSVPPALPLSLSPPPSAPASCRLAPALSRQAGALGRPQKYKQPSSPSDTPTLPTNPSPVSPLPVLSAALCYSPGLAVLSCWLFVSWRKTEELQ